MADEGNRFTLRGHSFERFDQFIGFLGGQDGGWLIHNENICAPIKNFQDLDTLLLANGELPNFGSRINVDAELFCQITDLLVILFEIKSKAGCIKTDDDIFGHGLIFDQHKVLMDHANPIGNRIPWRIETNFFSIDANFTRLRFIEPGEHIHEGALARSIFA